MSLKFSRFKYILTFITFVLSLLPAAAALTVRYDKLRPLTLPDGLSDLLVNVIYKDSEGYVWFGTESALDRFDGNRLTSYAIETPSKLSKRVNAIAEGDGCIFAGTAQGLFILKPGMTRPEPVATEEINCRVNALLSDGKERLYIGCQQGVFILDKTTGKLTSRLLVNDKTSEENDVKGFAIDGGKGIWVLASHKLWYLSFWNNTLRDFALPVDASATRIERVGEMLFIGTKGDGVVPFNVLTTTFGQPIKLGNGLITSVSATQSGILVIGTDGEGAFIYSPSRKTLLGRMNSSNVLRSNSVYSTMIDSDGLIWIGYYQSGADYTPLEEDVVTVYSFEGVPDLSRTAVRSLGVDGETKVIGTHNGVYVVNEETRQVTTFDKEQLGSNQIFTIFPRGGRFYIGTYTGGLYELNASTMRLRRFGPEELAEKSVFIITADTAGNLWAGTSAGLYRFAGGDETAVSRYTATNSPLPADDVFEIFFDSMGRGWICTEKGMVIWDGNELTASQFPNGFIQNMKIRAVYEDRNHNLYFLPDRGHAWKSDLTLADFSEIGAQMGSRFTMATSFIEDDYGRFWIGTDKNLTRYESEDSYVLYNYINGVANPTYTLCKPYKDPNGDIYMGSSSGLHKINIGRSGDIDSSVKIRITDISNHGKSIAGRVTNNTLTLGRNEDELAFSLSDLRYRNPEHFLVEYKLEGIDNAWNAIDGTHSPHYYDISPGDYTLRVREPGNPRSEMTLEIHKSSSLWATLIIIILAMSGLAAIVWLGMSFIARGRRDSGKEAPAGVAVAAAEPEATTGKTDAKKPYRTTSLSAEECKRLFKKLEATMKSERPYTNPDLKIGELAKMVDSSAHALSFLFNQYLNKSYYDYVNEYRVQEFKRLVTEVDPSKYTLSALAEKCGFSSRASFFRHFKALTGQTPSEYLNS